MQSVSLRKVVARDRITFWVTIRHWQFGAFNKGPGDNTVTKGIKLKR